MFCPKCGKELPDGVAFCDACGAQIGAAEEAPKPVEQKTALFTKPDVPTIIVLAVATLAFIFGFLPFIRYGYYNGLFSVAGVFLWLSYIFFPAFAASQVLNFNRFLKFPFPIAKWTPVVYYGLYAASLFFYFIGAIVTGFKSYPAVWWYFALVICATGLVIALVPNLLKKIVGGIKK